MAQPKVRRLAATRHGPAAVMAIVLCVAAWSASAGKQSLAADPHDQAALVQAHLDAGEFAPALQLARDHRDRNQRDQILGQIAQAQARAGAREAALNTAAEIRDERERSAALRQMAPPATPQTGDARPGAFGGAQADFTSLIDLITSTIAPTTWDEVGGPGSVKEFPGGVYVDAEGVLVRQLKVDRSKSAKGLAAVRLAALEVRDAAPSKVAGVRKTSQLRKISLPRLERELQLLAAAGKRPTEEMSVLAGLEKIEYVLVYPQTGDIVLAGPAGDWKTGSEGRIVGRSSNRPVLRLDDLVVVMRYMLSADDARFGCSITPVPGALARTQAFLEESKKKSIGSDQRGAWLKKLRSQLGRQTIEIDGIDPRTRVGQVMVEADYRMKLVGMGLEDGVVGVPSYLDMIHVGPGESPPPMDVLRWWFTLNYDAIETTDQHDAFELKGQGVKVLSENELLDAKGKRVHTGNSNALTAEFAQNFTKHFPELAAKYPIYAELKNIFDLALVSALVKTEKLPDRVDWRMTCFAIGDDYQVPLGAPPQMVETVVNHRVINKIHIVAGVSGGVEVDPWKYVEPKAVKLSPYGVLPKERAEGVPKTLPERGWWWD